MTPCPLPPGAKIWGYTRDSGGDSQDKSTADQRQAILDYSQQHSLICTNVFSDEARRGSVLAGRDGLDAMRSQARQDPRPVDGVIFWDFSRLFRGFDAAQWIKGELRAMGYVIISITDDIPDGTIGRVVEAIHDWKNEEELRRLSVNVSRALQALAREGYAPGGVPPRGYKAQQVFIGYRRRNRQGRAEREKRYARQWVPDPDLAPKVRQAFALRAVGTPIREIHRQLRLYKTPHSYTTFFRNKTYLGIRKCGELEIPDAHESLVDPDTWAAVQRQMERSRETGRAKRPRNPLAEPRRMGSPYLLSGILCCDICGSRMVGDRDGAGRRFYICARKQINKSACASRRAVAEPLEAAVIQAVLDDVLTPDYVEQIVSQVNANLTTHQARALETVAGLRRDLGACRRQIANLLDLIEQFGAQSGLERLREREAEQRQIEAQIQEWSALAEQQPLSASPDVIAVILADLRAGFGTDDARQRREFVARFLDSVHAGKVKATCRIVYKFPLDALALQPVLANNVVLSPRTDAVVEYR